MTAQKWLAIDCDAGIDDAMALCLAFKLGRAAGYELKLVSCVQGNCPLDMVTLNVMKCRAYSERGDVQVVAGADRALDGTQLDACYFHGDDGLGDAQGLMPVPGSDAVVDPGVCGIQSLVDLARASKNGENPVHLTVVALGPLTNVARALSLDPAFADNVDELVFLGGCGNAKGNATRVAEFNVCNDVRAAAEVFSKWAPRETLTVVSWDFCMAHPIPWATYDELLAVDHEQHTLVGDFLARILRKAFGPGSSSRTPGGRGAVICDAYAVAYCLRPDLFVADERVHIEVEQESPLTKGMTVVDYGHCYDGANRARNVRWVERMCMEGFSKMLKSICMAQSASC